MNRKLKIVHIEDYFNPTAGYQVNEFVKFNSELENIVICSYDMSPFYKTYSEKEDLDCEKKYGIKIIRLPTLLKYSHRILLKGWLKTVRMINPDILFMHGIGDFKDLKLWGRKLPFTIVRDCHMSWVASQNRFAVLFFKIFAVFFAPIINKGKKYEKVYALGFEEEQYLKKLGLKDKVIDRMPHGYDPKSFFFSEIERKELRRELNIDDNDILISYIGKLDIHKRPDLIFDCIELLSSEYLKKNKLVLLFVGPSSKDYILKTFDPKMKKFRDDVKIIIRDAIPANKLRVYYCATDICFWPKQTTLSSIHAQACGTPVIMEAQESNKERVIDHTGLFSINDIADSCIALEKLISQNKNVHYNIIKAIKDRNNVLLMKILISKWKILLSH